MDITQVTYFPAAKCVQFPNGLVIYLGDESEEDPMMASPAAYHDIDEARSYAEEGLEDGAGMQLPEAERRAVDVALDWLYDHYEDSDDYDKTTAEQIDDTLEDWGGDF